MNYHLRMLCLSIFRFKKEWYINFQTKSISENLLYILGSTRCYGTPAKRSVLKQPIVFCYWFRRHAIISAKTKSLCGTKCGYIYILRHLFPHQTTFFISLKEKKEGTDKQLLPDDLWYVIINRCPNSKGIFVKPPLKLRHGSVIMPHYFISMDSIIWSCPILRYIMLVSYIWEALWFGNEYIQKLSILSIILI